MNYWDFYNENKNRWSDLFSKQNKTDDEKKTLRLLDTIEPIVQSVERGEVGAIPKRFCRCSLENFTANNQALTDAKKLVENKVERLASGSNFVIRGAVGVGKTHLAVAISWELLVRSPRHDVIFLPIVDFVSIAKEVIDKRPSAERLVEECARVSWLVLDDLGQERPTEWTRELVYTLVSRRYNYCLPTIVTTNLTPQEISERYGDPVSSRLFGGATVVAILGKDRRSKKNDVSAD